MAPVRSSATSCMAEKVAWLDAYEMAAGIRILWRCLACGRLPHSLLGGILTARSQTLPSQSTALPIRPSWKPARSPHQPAHPFAFDSLPLCMLSGRSHARGHPVAVMGVQGRPDSRNVRDNNPVIVSLLPGGGLQIGRRFQNNSSVTPAFGGTALVAEF